MEPDPTLSAMAARAIVLAAARYGVSPPDLCARTGLDPAVLADVDARVPVKVMIALWEAVAPLDADFGLHLAEMAVAAQPALPWHLLRASATLGDGILRLLSAWRIFNDFHPPEVVLPSAGSEEGILRMRTKDTPYPPPRHAVEFAFGWFVVAARQATGAEVNPRRIAFEHPRPPSLAEHERILRCELKFDADYSEIVFSRDAMSLPTLGGGDTELVMLLERHAEALLAKLPPRGAFSATVRAALMPLLAAGDVTVERIADKLGASVRSIQRRLRDEGTTFQRVLDELRREVATEYLTSHTHSIAEVALLLGFSDQTAFHRAFVRWTGRTPGEVRRSAR
jgi:AraC-like DNA-binding protein